MELFDFGSMIFALGKNIVSNFKKEELSEMDELTVQNYMEKLKNEDSAFLFQRIGNCNKLESIAISRILNER